MYSDLQYIALPKIKLRGTAIDLVYPKITYSSEGKRILLITDSLSVEEAISNKLFDGRVGQTVANIFERAIELEGILPANVLSVTTRVVKQQSQLSDAERGENFRKITRRICQLIKRYKPEVIVFLGHQSFLNIWRNQVKFTERSYLDKQLLMLRGRLLPAEIAGHHCQILLSFSPRAFASLDYKDSKNRVNLTGFVLHDMQTALRGKNLYTVPAIDKTKHKIIRSIAEFDQFYELLLKAETPSLDTESDNLNRVYGNKLFCLLASFDGESAYLLPLFHPQTPFTGSELNYIVNKLRQYFEFSRSKYLIFQNAKFDLLMFFAELKIRFCNHRIYDLMAGEYFLDENRKFFSFEQLPGGYSLEFIGAQYGALGYEDSPIAKEDRGRMAEFSLEQIMAYGDKDVCYPAKISQFQIAEAKRRGPQYRMYLRSVCELGSDMVLTFVEMERNGVLTDLNYLTSLMAPNNPLNLQIGKIIENFQRSPAAIRANQRIQRKIGIPKNSHGLFGNKYTNAWLLDINKPKHQQALFFDVLKLQPLEYRKDGGGKTNKVFLEEYKESVPEVALLADYRQHEKLRNTYVTGLFKQLTEHIDNSTDQRLRASYWFIYILTVRSCFTPDTPIYVLDDRCIVPIKDIKAGDWVWSYNKNLQPVPSQVSWSGRTKKAKTVTVMYQGYHQNNGAKYGKVNESVKTIECSADEQFRLRDGNYRRADKLRPGDRILALERHYNKEGYRRLYYTGMPTRRILEHQYVVKHRHSFITHHDNEITDDNVPTNLVEMTQSKHMKTHDFHAYTKRNIKISRNLRKQYRKGILKSSNKGLLGKENPNYKPLDKDWAIKTLMKNNWHPTIFRDKYKMDYTITMRKLKELGIDCNKMRQRYNGKDRFITDKMLIKAAKFNSINEAAAYLKINYYKAKKLLAEDQNHIIIKITKNNTKKWLYDLKIPKYHNFIANGLCVHNSSTNPNLQNLPSRGPLAKIIKRLLIATINKILVKADYSAHEVRNWANISRDKRIAASFIPGMLLRRKIRILRGLNYKLDNELADWLEENNWDDIKDIKDKQKLIKKTSNNPELFKLLELIIDLEVRGDVHKINYEFFFGVSAANVSKDQRQSIKEVVFGTIYDKQAVSLAGVLYKKEIQPIRRKYIADINQARLNRDDERLQELLDDMNKELQPYYQQAQELIDKLFSKFKRGGRWIKNLQKSAAENLYVVSPIGPVRHLWAYLHSERNVHKVMDRRGPNSIIQGSASNIGYTAARIMTKLAWQSHLNNLDLGYLHNNFVHDSIESEANIAMLPLTLYFMEHSLLSQVHKRLRETYGFDLIVGLEADLEIGAAASRMQKFDFTESNLLRTMAQEIDWMRQELGYKLHKAELLDCLKHNFRIINKYRIQELQAMGDSHRPNETMLLTPEIAKTLTWQLPSNGKVVKTTLIANRNR